MLGGEFDTSVSFIMARIRVVCTEKRMLWREEASMSFAVRAFGASGMIAPGGVKGTSKRDNGLE